MSFSKQYLKSKPLCKVKFKLTKEEAQSAKAVAIAGDFNDWDETASPMKKLKNGDFSFTVDLPVESTVQFRYLLDGETWENDWSADAYVPSPVSFSDNSVINV